jgi:hypothetical protein
MGRPRVVPCVQQERQGPTMLVGVMQQCVLQGAVLFSKGLPPRLAATYRTKPACHVLCCTHSMESGPGAWPHSCRHPAARQKVIVAGCTLGSPYHCIALIRMTLTCGGGLILMGSKQSSIQCML